MNSNDPIKVAVVAPVTVGVSLLAAGCSFAAFAGRDVSWMTFDPGTLHAQPWRALTSTILHGGVPHLVFNLMWMWSLGVALEAAWGSLRTLAVYILFGVGAALSEYALSNSAIGLSGVVYGLFGLIWFAQRNDPMLRGVVTRLTAKTFIFWFFLCILCTWTGMMNIANTAHGVGAVLGGLLGLAVSARAPARRFAAWAGLTASAAALVLAAAELPRVWRPGSAPAVDERRGYELLLSERFEEAVKTLQPIVDAGEGGPRTRLALGYALLRVGRTEEGIQALRAGVEAADPSIRAEFTGMLGETLVGRALQLQAANDLPAAFDAFREAVRWSPPLEERFAMQGAWFAEGAGDPHEAARLYRLAAANPLYRDRALQALDDLGLSETPDAP